MFVRLTVVKDVTEIDAVATVLQDKAIPEVIGQRGFQGLTASGNREAREVGIVSAWATLEDLEASDSVASKLRGVAVAEIGGSATVHVLEQVYGEFKDRPAVGSPLRLVSVTAAPERIDQGIERFRSTVLPAMQAQSGYVGGRFMVDRSAGRAIAGTVWADEGSMRADDERSQQRRADAASDGIEVSEPTYREVLFHHTV